MENQSSVESLIDRVKNYVETRIDLLRLKAIDKSSSVLSLIISLVVVGLIGFICFIFISIGLALLLGELLGKSYYGFFVIALLYLIIGLVMYSMRDKIIEAPVTNSMIKKLLD
ncbi:MAG TPA: phage holin family protein [Chitinophagaceae bacterium]|nr:phage holin family protein [Chitinophagaceae bacterium]